MRERLGDRLPKFSEAEKELLQNAIDFVGLNHYTTRFIAHVENPGDIHFYQVQQMERIGIFIKILMSSLIMLFKLEDVFCSRRYCDT